jgi:hypothetical protein
MKESTIVERRMKTYTAACFLLLVNGYAVCQTPAPKKTSVTVRPQQPAVGTRDAVIEELQKEVKELRQKLISATELKETIDALWLAISRHTDDIQALHHYFASLDPASPGKYSRTETDAGFLLVSLGKVEPYLDGYKVELRIGNPHQMDFKGFEVIASWGPRKMPSPGTVSIAEWLKKLRTQTFSFTNQLAGGRWNSVSLILPSTKPEDFGSLSVSLNVNTVSLGGPISQ